MYVCFIRYAETECRKVRSLGGGLARAEVAPYSGESGMTEPLSRESNDGRCRISTSGVDILSNVWSCSQSHRSHVCTATDSIIWTWKYDESFWSESAFRLPQKIPDTRIGSSPNTNHFNLLSQCFCNGLRSHSSPTNNLEFLFCTKKLLHRKQCACQIVQSSGQIAENCKIRFRFLVFDQLKNNQIRTITFQHDFISASRNTIKCMMESFSHRTRTNKNIFSRSDDVSTCSMLLESSCRGDDGCCIWRTRLVLLSRWKSGKKHGVTKNQQARTHKRHPGCFRYHKHLYTALTLKLMFMMDEKNVAKTNYGNWSGCHGNKCT